jgi:hypothetical protein
MKLASTGETFNRGNERMTSAAARGAFKSGGGNLNGDCLAAGGKARSPISSRRATLPRESSSSGRGQDRGAPTSRLISSGGVSTCEGVPRLLTTPARHGLELSSSLIVHCSFVISTTRRFRSCGSLPVTLRAEYRMHRRPKALCHLHANRRKAPSFHGRRYRAGVSSQTAPPRWPI